jgi:hypothetical protein
MRKPEDIAFGEGTFADALRLHKAWLNNEEGGKRLIVPAGFGLDGASLDGIRSAFNCIGNREQIKSAQIERYSITYDAKFLQIGCQRHTIEDWRNFDTAKIRRMDGEAAVNWWAKWNEIIFQIIEMSPATPGKAAPPSGDVQ